MKYSSYDKIKQHDSSVDELIQAATGLNILTGEEDADFYTLLDKYTARKPENLQVLASVAGRLQYLSDQMMLIDDDEALTRDDGFLDLAAKRDSLTEIAARLPERERRDYYQMKAASYTLIKSGYDGAETSKHRSK